MSHYCEVPNRTVAGDASTCPDCVAAQAVALALLFRTYQAALNDDAYWKSPEEREKNKQQVGEAFDQLVQLTNQILGDV